MKPRRFVIAPDIHGSLMDERACDAVLAFTKDFKPDVRVSPTVTLILNEDQKTPAR